jgi:hypothetical protein
MLTGRPSSNFRSSSTTNTATGRPPPSSFISHFSTNSRSISLPPSPLTPTASPNWSTAVQDEAGAPPKSKEKEKSTSRYILSDTELEVVTRNAEELLRLHEHFVSDMQVAMSALGFPTPFEKHLHAIVDGGGTLPHPEHIDAAIRIVSTKFATEVCSCPLWFTSKLLIY